MIADNTFFLGNAAPLVTHPDLRLLEISADDLPLRRAAFPPRAAPFGPIRPNSITGTASRFRIAGLFRDAESGRLNRDVKLCIPSPDGHRCTVVSLSVSDTAYEANRSYFDSLF